MAALPTRRIEKTLNDFEEKLKIVVLAQKRAAMEISELKKENRSLKEINLKLTDEYRVLKKNNNQLQKDFNKSKKIAKIVANKLTPSGGISEIRESVEEYIKEIDKCIEILRGTL